MLDQDLLPGVAPDGSDDDIKPLLSELARLNPEFRDPKTQRAQKFVDAIFLDEKGEQLPENVKRRNMEEAMIKIGAIIEQLRQNPLWKEILARADEEEANSDGRPSRVASTETEFEEAASRTIYKTLQEPLTPEEFRLNVPRGYGEKEPIMAVVTIGLDNINNKLLENLGLHHLKPAPGTRRKEKLAAYRLALPQIKAVLESLEPIALPHETDDKEIHFFRLMRFASGPNEGLILGSQHIRGKKRFFQTDLYKGFRRIDCHIRENYGNEIKSLISEIDQPILEVDRAVTEDWENIKNTPEELTRLQTWLTEIEAKLVFVTDEHKVEIRRLMGRCASFRTARRIPARFGFAEDGSRVRTSEGRVVEALNPRAMRPMWHKAMREVGKRIDNIAHIEGRLREDTARLNAMIGEQEAPFVKFYDEVKAGHEMYKIMRGEVNSKNAEQVCRNLRALKSRFTVESKDKSPIKYQPYLAFAEKMTGHVDATIAILEKEPIDAQAAATEFVKIFVVAKMERFYHDLQMIYGEHLAPERLPFFAALKASVMKATITLNADRINPAKEVSPKRVATPEYDEIYKRMHGLLRALNIKSGAGIRAMNKKKGKDEDLAKKLKGEMQQLIHDFDMVKILKEESGVEQPKPRTARQMRLDLTKTPEKK